MSQPLTVSLPPGLALKGGCKVVVAALDPSDGTYAGGVTITNVSLQVATDNPDELAYGPFMLVTGPQGAV